METLKIITLFVGVLMLIIVLAVCITELKGKKGLSLSVFLLSCFGCILISLSDNKGYDNGQIDALKGKYKYKIQITYEKKDSIFIPKDTTYIEIK